MQLELTPDEKTAADTLVREHWTKAKPESGNNTINVMVWLVLIGLFIFFYGLFEKPDGAPPPPPRPPFGGVEWSALTALLAGAAAAIGVLKAGPRRLTPSKLIGAAVSIDGLELVHVKGTTLHPWAAIEDVLEGPSVVVVKVKPGGKVLAFPKRMLGEGLRTELVYSLQRRANPREPEGLEPARYAMTLSRPQRRALHRFGKDLIDTRWRPLLASLVASTAGGLTLALRHHLAWVIVAALPALAAGYLGWVVLRALYRAKPLALQVGDAGLRWVGPELGAQLAWTQIDAWAERRGMLMIRAHDRVLPVLESAVPGPVYRSIRERLPRQS